MRPVALSLLTAAALCACGGSEPAPDEAVQPATEEVLNKVVMENGNEITFTRVTTDTPDGPYSEVMTTELILADTVDVVAEVRAKAGALTNLEVFQAVAPAGTKPHPALLASHGEEARVLKRGDAAIKNAAPLAREAISSGAVTACNNFTYTVSFWVTANQWIKSQGESTSNTAFLCLGRNRALVNGAPTANSCTESFSTREVPVVAAVCNTTDSSADMTVKYGVANNGGPWSLVNGGKVPKGASARSTTLPTGQNTSKRMAVYGEAAGTKRFYLATGVGRALQVGE